jgi:hypothetical protein
LDEPASNAILLAEEQHVMESPNATDPSAFWSSEKIAAVTVLCVLTPFTIGGNLLVIIAVAKCRQLKSTTNYYLVSLAIADICTGLFAPLFIAEEVLKDSISSTLLCLGPHCLLMTVCGVSVMSLAAIAYDRYTALTRPFEYLTIMTFRKMFAFSVFAWMYSACIAWMPMMQLHDHTPSCSFRLIRREPLIVLLACLFLPAYLVIFFCYSRIFCIARHHARDIAAVQNSLQRQIELSFVAKDTKYAKTLAIVVGFFVLLWLPFQLCILTELVSDIVIDDWVRDFLALLSYCNSGINPWIYSLRNPDFKRAFLDIIIDCLSSCGFMHDWHDESPGTLSSYLKARAEAYASRNSSYGGWTPWNGDTSRRSSGPLRRSSAANTLDIESASRLVPKVIVEEPESPRTPQKTIARSQSAPVFIPDIKVDLCDGGGSPVNDFIEINRNNNCSVSEPLLKNCLSVPRWVSTSPLSS